jgi:hypothetical protein
MLGAEEKYVHGLMGTLEERGYVQDICVNEG